MKQETCLPLGRGQIVAPHVGAWIETLAHLPHLRAALKSPPTWGRGLKLDRRHHVRVPESRPPRGGVD